LTGEENTAEIDEKLNQYFDSILTSLEWEEEKIRVWVGFVKRQYRPVKSKGHYI
jgi:hypothetical protein